MSPVVQTRNKPISLFTKADWTLEIIIIGSPILSLVMFFLWGFWKTPVYFNRPKTLQNLKGNIQTEIVNIFAAMR